IELVDPLRDYGFDQDVFEPAFIPFRIDKDLGGGKVRLKRVKESLFDSEEKGPYARLPDPPPRCRVKFLNHLFPFESKLSVDEVEDEIREDQNSHFMHGKAIHTFEELTSILDYMPAGYDTDEEVPAKGIEEEEDHDLPELDEAEEEKLKNDESLKWDKDDDDEKKKDDDEDDEEDEESDEDKKPRPKTKGKR